VLAGGSNLARPEDLRRDNILLQYVPSTGESRDPIKTSDYQPERVALGSGSCFAFFTSYYRNQARLHVWGLVLQGDDLTRLDLPARASAVAEEPGTHAVAVALESGLIKTWTVSGATPADCDAYRAPTQVVANQPKTTLGSETSPLVKAGPGTRLAVLRFDVTGVDPTLGDAVAEMIGGELSNNPQVTVIERSAIDKVLKEMEIQRSGLTTADAVKIGKGLNARTVLLGSVRKFGDTTYIIQTRAVDVETQQVQGSRDVTCENCKEGDLPRAVRTLRSAIVP
jgi:TolB-like protein